MASKLLVLGARPFGMTPGGGWRALFITLLQLATMVRMVSDSSWDTLLQRGETAQGQTAQDWVDRPQTRPQAHPAQDCRQASMVAKVSGGSWELLGWSLSGGRPPIIEGQRRFRNVTQAWINGSFGRRNSFFCFK